ncbi:Peptide transporter PTR1 [Auxenochlorella protothecoides]|uniref:Peptide transporter PTR1 n=1 Tax=Auxenochlorella protothecoides TaxID=3075 RepID=A0A087SLD8_AUXPR|nr:Peptide transporter PTR1 [Auxenochlorella protothecoides]KFM26542.1 Peptide transporter PTR1 [Auxenochlorella protothecoides]
MSINIVVYLTSVLNENNATAAQNVNAWSGTCYLTPLLGAWVADTFLGRFWAIFSGSIIYMLGLTGVTISAGLPSLTPAPGEQPTAHQLSFFWGFMYLVAIGTGGIKPCVSTFGADQFDEDDPAELAMIPRFYNWFYAFINIGAFLACTLIVWVQTDVSWTIGFLIPTVSFAIAIAVFLAGSKWYRRKPPGGSALTRWFRVIAGAFAHWRAAVPEVARLLHEVDTPMSIIPGQTRMIHTPEFRWLDKAATPVEAAGVRDRWLVIVTEVEELKCMVRLLPSMAILAVYFAIYAQMSTLFVLQGSAMDRHLGSWVVPATMVNVLDSTSVLIWVPIFDLGIEPYFRRIGRPISRLTRMGVGFGIAILSMVCAAPVEIFHLKAVRANNLQIPQYFLVGMSEVFASVGSLEFFYSQSQEAMRSIASALSLVAAAAGSYLAVSLVAAITSVSTRGGATGWVANNLNQGHIDDFFWLLAVLMGVALLAYIPICYTYRYRQDPAVGFALAAAADRERDLGIAAAGADDLAKVSSRVVVDRAPKRSSFVPPVHAFEIAPVSLGVKGGSLSTKPSEN